MTSDFTNALKMLKLKVTTKRLAILDVLSRHSRYLSPEEVWSDLRRRFSSIGLPTVYRNLEELADRGVVAKIIHPNRQLYYFLCRDHDHHHHFICLSCRKVEELRFCALEGVEREVRRRLKGEVLSHIVQVNGLCSICKLGAKGADDEAHR